MIFFKRMSCILGWSLDGTNL